MGILACLQARIQHDVDPIYWMAILKFLFFIVVFSILMLDFCVAKIDFLIIWDLKGREIRWQLPWHIPTCEVT